MAYIASQTITCTFDTNLHAAVTMRQATVDEDLLTRCLLDMTKLRMLPEPLRDRHHVGTNFARQEMTIGSGSLAHSQGCTDLQSLITCLDHGDIVAQHAVTQGCVRLRDSLNGISEAIFTVMVWAIVPLLWPA